MSTNWAKRKKNYGAKNKGVLTLPWISALFNLIFKEKRNWKRERERERERERWKKIYAPM